MNIPISNIEGSIPIQIEPGEPSTGHWCEECALPSLVKVPVNCLYEGGVVQPGEVSYCSQHDNLPEP